MNDLSLLEQMGFSRNEALIYLAALELGLSLPKEIAKKANIKRTTAYSVLEYLVQRGVIRKFEERRKTKFLAEPPEKLHFMISNLQEQFTKILPELKARYNAKDIKPKITYYEGNKAIQNVYDDTLREKPEEILEWNTNTYFERKNVDPTYIEKRVELNIKAKRMATANSQWHKKHKLKDKEELAKTIVLPSDKFNLGIEVNIYNNKIAFLNYAENMSVIIESKAIADAMKQIYELSWLGAKTIEVK
jgi:sugar-specific transcriptional regulator TrmB